MINIQKLIENAKESGYRGDNASAKVCQDIVLKALATGPLSRNVTIKGVPKKEHSIEYSRHIRMVKRESL